MTTDVWTAVMDSPLGPLGLTGTEGALTSVDFLPRGTALKAPATPLAREVAAQLERYFADPAQDFDLPLDTGGSDFQRRVWAALREIPPAAPVTYGELALRLGSAARAVGGACRANPIPIIVPCHRVVARGGEGGYSGATSGEPMTIKRWLLSHEGFHRFQLGS